MALTDSLDLDRLDWLTASARRDLLVSPTFSGHLTQCLTTTTLEDASSIPRPEARISKHSSFYSLRGNHFFGFKTNQDATENKPINSFQLDRETICKIYPEKLILSLTRKNRSLVLTAYSEAELHQWQTKIYASVSPNSLNETKESSSSSSRSIPSTFSPIIGSGKKKLEKRNKERKSGGGVHSWEWHRPTIPIPCFACKKHSLKFRQEGFLCQGCGAWVHTVCRENVITPCDLQQKRRKNSNRYCEELHKSQVASENESLKIEKLYSLSILKPFLHLDHYQIEPIELSSIRYYTADPEEDGPKREESHYLDDLLAIHQVSTYPRDTLSQEYQRMGDPIADQFAVARLKERVVAVLADGCSWGGKAWNAARDGCLTLLDYILNFDPNDTGVLGEILMKGCSVAHQRIIERESPGTATVCGGMLARISTDKRAKKEDASLSWGKVGKKGSKMKRDESFDKWAFVCINVGDCKALLFSRRKKEFSDITCGNRENLTNPSDPGGRLGSYKENGDPDLRNLQLFYTTLEEDDIIILVSDGVHDNLDPSSLNVSPQEAADAAGLEDLQSLPSDWQKVSPLEGSRIKEQYMAYLLREKVFGDVDLQTLTPRMITDRLTEECRRVTGPIREWMEVNPGKRQPEDKALFPGKMDHVSVIAIAAKERIATPKDLKDCKLPSPSFSLSEENLMENLSLSIGDELPQQDVQFAMPEGTACRLSSSSGVASEFDSSSKKTVAERPRSNSVKKDGKMRDAHLQKEPRFIKLPVHPIEKCDPDVMKNRSPMGDDKKKTKKKGEKTPDKVNKLEEKKKKSGVAIFGGGKNFSRRDQKHLMGSSNTPPQLGGVCQIPPLGEGEGDSELQRFLNEIRMEAYFPLFTFEKIDLVILRYLSALELRAIGLPLGDAKRIQLAVQQKDMMEEMEEEEEEE